MLESVRGEASIAALSRREGVALSVNYKRLRGFIEAGKPHLAGNVLGESMLEIRLPAIQTLDRLGIVQALLYR